MAESPMNVEMPTEEAKVECDDYSSGSDKSFEIEDVDGTVQSNPTTTGHQIHTESLRSRRKRRQGSHGSRRQKGGSRHKHKGYQPYLNSENIELQLKRKSLELQQKENAAAVVRHEGAEQFMIFPVAPFNSTQFLMDEHSENSSTDVHKSLNNIILNSCCSPQERESSVPLTPGESNLETITFEKKDKEFTDFFTTAHAESLQSLPKSELVKHYINLEEKIAALEKKVAEAETHQRQEDNSYSKVDKACVCDSMCNSDTNSLSSSNEEFVDLSTVNQASENVDETVFCTEEKISSYSEDVKHQASENCDETVFCTEISSYSEVVKHQVSDNCDETVFCTGEKISNYSEDVKHQASENCDETVFCTEEKISSYSDVKHQTSENCDETVIYTEKTSSYSEVKQDSADGLS